MRTLQFQFFHFHFRLLFVCVFCSLKAVNCLPFTTCLNTFPLCVCVCVHLYGLLSVFFFIRESLKCMKQNSLLGGFKLSLIYSSSSLPLPFLCSWMAIKLRWVFSLCLFRSKTICSHSPCVNFIALPFQQIPTVLNTPSIVWCHSKEDIWSVWELLWSINLTKLLDNTLDMVTFLLL